MAVIIKYAQADNNVRITIEVNFGRSMIEKEKAIQDALNDAGRSLTADALEYLDTNSSPITIGTSKLTHKR